jgi:hypothetical protein
MHVCFGSSSGVVKVDDRLVSGLVKHLDVVQLLE